MKESIYWLWDHSRRVFLLHAREFQGPTILRMAEAHRYCSAKSLNGADYRLVFEDGEFFSYEIDRNQWEETESQLRSWFGKPIKANKEISCMEKKKLSANHIQQIVAGLLLIGVIIYLVAFR